MVRQISKLLQMYIHGLGFSSGLRTPERMRERADLSAYPPVSKQEPKLPCSIGSILKRSVHSSFTEKAIQTTKNP